MFDKKIFKEGFSPFHIVSQSPWPLVTSVAIFFFMFSTVSGFFLKDIFSLSLFLCIMFMFFCFFGWQKDILKESTLEGAHTNLVQKGLKIGMILFIISEILFFASFFWSMFYYKISPSVNLGGWPPMGILPMDPFSAPLVGTMILMSSGVTVTWSHHSVLENKWRQSVCSLFLTIFLGLSFTYLQYMEYASCPFSISDSVYGSIFFTLTGFHGLHVMVGSLFLLVALVRLMTTFSFSSSQHVGLEMSIWYWHFVDVVWLFLFIFLYF